MLALFGILSAIALLAAAALLNGAPAAYLNVSGLMIVLFGTLAVTMASFRWDDVFKLPGALMNVLFAARVDVGLAAQSVVQLAQKARRDGALSLQKVLPSVEQEPYLHRALSMVVDGMSPQEIDGLLQLENIQVGRDETLVRDIMNRAGQAAPALGLIGTLIGLIQMLGQLSDPAAIGPAMAVALLTTFYGAFLAHIICYPLAAIAERTAARDRLLRDVYATAARSMSRQENPKKLEMSLNALLPTDKKIAA